MSRRRTYSLALAAMIGALATALFAAAPALAHPHVFITAQAAVRLEHESVAAVSHEWTFDEIYSAGAVEGFDANKDGKYDREELAELARDTIVGLKDYGYFTAAKSSAGEVTFGEPKEYWFEQVGGLLKLHFLLPLAQPVAANAAGVSVYVGDPTYYIGFDFAKENPVRFDGAAPTTCSVAMQPPEMEGMSSGGFDVKCGLE